jgi:BlaI family transcriptional regulator, penicillinase repressor
MQTLSRRERQILDILYEQGKSTAADILAALPDPPSYSAIRALLRILEEKGHVTHESDGPRYVFRPRVGKDRARKNALRHMMQTFFNNSASDAVAALLDASSAELKPEDLDRMEGLIEQARAEKAQKERK